MPDSPTDSPIATVTTSWDDGCPLDVRLAELLSMYSVAGTFYVPLRPHEQPPLTVLDLRAIHRSFEIGSHSITHRDLRYLDDRQLHEEIHGSKAQLQDIVGTPVRVFAYPMGRNDCRVRRAVRGAGYVGARGTRELRLTFGGDPWCMATTVSALPTPSWVRARRGIRAGNWHGLWLLCRRRRGHSWVDLACGLFEEVVRHGGVWHLWGHSWEIEQFGLWNDLKTVLRAVSGRPGVRYCANGEVLDGVTGRPAPSRPVVMAETK